MSITAEDSLFFIPFSLQTKSIAVALLLQPLGFALSVCITHMQKVSCFGSTSLYFCISFYRGEGRKWTLCSGGRHFSYLH